MNLLNINLKITLIKNVGGDNFKENVKYILDQSMNKHTKNICPRFELNVFKK